MCAKSWRCSVPNTPRPALVGRDERPGDHPLKRAGRVDGGQALDCADKGTALAYDAISEVEVITVHWNGKLGHNGTEHEALRASNQHHPSAPDLAMRPLPQEQLQMQKHRCLGAPKARIGCMRWSYARKAQSEGRNISIPFLRKTAKNCCRSTAWSPYRKTAFCFRVLHFSYESISASQILSITPLFSHKLRT